MILPQNPFILNLLYSSIQTTSKPVILGHAAKCQKCYVGFGSEERGHMKSNLKDLSTELFKVLAGASISLVCADEGVHSRL